MLLFFLSDPVLVSSFVTGMNERLSGDSQQDAKLAGIMCGGRDLQTEGIHFGRFGGAKTRLGKRNTVLSQKSCWLNELKDCDQTSSA